jgi:hypothetical protein
MGFSLPVIGWKPTAKTEMEDLYSFIENKTITHPNLGEVPFTLYPFQKEILKQIHENDKIVIVKCRQMGMTTLLAGYAAWLSNRRPTLIINGGLWRTREWSEKLMDRFGAKNGYSNYNEETDYFKLQVWDEVNHDYGISWGNDFQVPLNEKIIVAGTPDKQRNLWNFVDYHSSWKTLVYPYYKCNPMWTEVRFIQHKDMLSCLYNSCNENKRLEQDIALELLCKRV